MQCVFSERLVKDLSTEFHEQFGHITMLSIDGYSSSHKAFLAVLRTHKMDSGCDNVMSGSHVWKVYYYRYSDNLDYTTCACKPLENFQCIFEG